MLRQLKQEVKLIKNNLYQSSADLDTLIDSAEHREKYYASGIEMKIGLWIQTLKEALEIELTDKMDNERDDDL